jgi:hypothetical protein
LAKEYICGKKFKKVCVLQRKHVHNSNFKRNYLEKYNDSEHAVKTKNAPFFMNFPSINKNGNFFSTGLVLSVLLDDLPIHKLVPPLQHFLHKYRIFHHIALFRAADHNIGHGLGSILQTQLNDGDAQVTTSVTILVNMRILKF